MRVLVVTTEPVPLEGLMTTGAGLRAWGLVQGLRSRGIQADVAMARDGVSRWPAEKQTQWKDHIFDRETLTEFVESRKPDVLVMQHWGLMDRLGPVSMPLAIDLAGPHLLERMFWQSKHPLEDIKDKINALSRADFLTCSGSNQRFYFMSYALMAGFDISGPDTLPIIPFSLSPDLPPEREHYPDQWVYAGMLLPWQNPSTAIRATIKVMTAKNRGTFHFVGGAHPGGDVSRGKFDAIMSELRLSEHARIQETRSFDALCDFLSRCGLAVDLMARNSERELAWPSRTVVYLACGLPVVHSAWSELADWISEYDAGWLADDNDPEAIERLLASILDDPDSLQAKRQNARRLVRDRLTWDKTISPLADWCANPTPRDPDQARDNLADYIKRLEAETDTISEAYNELKGRRMVKISDQLRRFRKDILP
ncbi:MAG: glycosyltransferase family 4 protein [bacterium]